jgi:hypothetical protein
MPASELIAAGTYAASQNSSVQDNRSNTGVLFMLDVTAAPSGSLTPTVQVYDPAAAAWADYAVFAAITGTGKQWFLLAPLGDGSTDGDLAEVILRPLPQVEWRLELVHGDASDWEYSIGVADIE